jgi:hypothetical protein
VKKTHVVLLVITAFTILFSAYSLAAFNQVYKISFEWYSQFNNRFLPDPRNSLDDEWKLSEYPEQMRFGIVTDKNGFNSMNKDIGKSTSQEILKTDFSKNVLIYVALGMVDSLDYRIKILDIAQRETSVEIKVTLNSPAEQKEKKALPSKEHFPKDIIRINKADFPLKGKLRFVFKNQYGKQLYECYSNIKG